VSCSCGSDLWPYGAMPPAKRGARMGHEFIGIIEDTGSEVTTLKKGDLVVSPFSSCDGTWTRPGTAGGHEPYARERRGERLEYRETADLLNRIRKCAA